MADFRDYMGLDLTGYLMHYGVGHEDGGHSGRYKWGSGERPYQRTAAEGSISAKKKDENSVSKRSEVRNNDELLKLAKMAEAGDDSDTAVDAWVKLQKEIAKKSVDWYNSKPKSEEAKALYKEYREKNKKDTRELKARLDELIKERDEARNNWFKNNLTYATQRLDKEASKVAHQIYQIESANTSAMKKKLVSIVLRDLGFADTEENRRIILDTEVLFWD